MAKAKKVTRATPATSARSKALVKPMSEERKHEIIAQYMDDVVAKLTTSFFEVGVNATSRLLAE